MYFISWYFFHSCWGRLHPKAKGFFFNFKILFVLRIEGAVISWVEDFSFVKDGWLFVFYGISTVVG